MSLGKRQAHAVFRKAPHLVPKDVGTRPHRSYGYIIMLLLSDNDTDVALRKDDAYYR